MIASSRPLRFIVLLLGGWITMRLALVWSPSGPPPAVIATVLPALPRKIAPSLAATAIDTAHDIAGANAWRHPAFAIGVQAAGSQRTPADSIPRLPEPVRFTSAPVSFNVDRPESATDGGPIGSPLPVAISPRLRVSAWSIVRGGTAATTFAPQLGGSQAGVRATYAVTDDRRLALAWRLSSALGTRQREASIGLDWQPTSLPIHLIAEQRIGIERTRGGPSVGVIAGIGPVPVTAGAFFEAYGQAGGIARDGGVEGFADGAARLARPVARIAAIELDIGIGAWGGAQRGAARLDMGPSVSARLPIGPTTLRVALDWRQRLVGNARPGSGAALSIGTDF